MNISDMLNSDIESDSSNGSSNKGPQKPKPPTNNDTPLHDQRRRSDDIGEGSSSAAANAPAEESSSAVNSNTPVGEGSSSAANASSGNDLANFLEKAKADELTRRASAGIPSKSVNLSDINFKLKTQDPYLDLDKERMVKNLHKIMLDNNLLKKKGKFASTIINPEFLESIRKF